MNIKTPGIHHLALRVSDYERSKRFYLETLGFNSILEKSGLCLFQAGDTVIAILAPADTTSRDQSFDPFSVGLDHLAIGCQDRKSLEEMEKALDSHGIENTGIKQDPLLDKEYIAFKDPDRISWEYYMI